jgi:hypothetical protein
LLACSQLPPPCSRLSNDCALRVAFADAEPAADAHGARRTTPRRPGLSGSAAWMHKSVCTDRTRALDSITIC